MITLCITALFFAILFHGMPANCAENELIGFILNDYLLKSYRSSEPWRTSQEEEIRFDTGISAKNCDEYLKAIKIARLEDDDHNIYIDCHYSNCFIMDDLDRAKSHTGYRPTSYANEIFKRLDINSFYSVFRNAFDQSQPTTLEKHKEGETTLTDTYTVEREVKDTYYI